MTTLFDIKAHKGDIGGSTYTPYKFNGKELDQETGYYYYGARYYDPGTALWFGVDPLQHKYPMNSPYIYCNGNPVKFVDLDGRESFFAGFIGYVKMVDEKIDQAFKGGSLNISADISIGVQFGADISAGPFSIGADLDMMSTEFVKYEYREDQSNKSSRWSSGFHSDYVEISQEASVNIGVPVIGEFKANVGQSFDANYEGGTSNQQSNIGVEGNACKIVSLCAKFILGFEFSIDFDLKEK